MLKNCESKFKCMIVLNAANAGRPGGSGLYNRGTVEEELVAHSDWMLSTALNNIQDTELQRHFLRYLLIGAYLSLRNGGDVFSSGELSLHQHQQDACDMLTALTVQGYSLFIEKAREKPMLMHHEGGIIACHCIDAAAPDLRYKRSLVSRLYRRSICALITATSTDPSAQDRALSDDFDQTQTAIDRVLSPILSCEKQRCYVACLIGCGAFLHDEAAVLASMVPQIYGDFQNPISGCKRIPFIAQKSSIVQAILEAYKSRSAGTSAEVRLAILDSRTFQ